MKTGVMHLGNVVHKAIFDGIGDYMRYRPACRRLKRGDRGNHTSLNMHETAQPITCERCKGKLTAAEKRELGVN